ncbi:MAG: type VI secretion IcmF C-terminal domain-containing protein, partial [Nitrosospira sp.]
MVYPAMPGQPAPIDAIPEKINELYTLLMATDAALKGGGAPPPSDVPTKIKADASRMPEPIRSILITLSTGGISQALGATRENLNQSLQASITEFCNKAIAGRYPFVKESSRDVTQDDFARLFSPGGLMDEFFQKNLARYVDTSTRPWTFRRVDDSSMGGSSGALQEFRRAEIIRDVFFHGGGHTPAMNLTFKPLEMDAAITQFILDVDGQLVKYSHGPQIPMTLQWPGPRGTSQVRLQISPTAASAASGQLFEGPWALFRMLDETQIAPTSQPEKFIVTFNVNGRKTRFEVITSSVQNPFRLNELKQFNCPRHF